MKWRGFHGNHETGHVQKAKLENRYTHSYSYNMRAARTSEPRVLERAEMPTGPSTKVEIPVPVVQEDRLDKENKDRGHVGGAKPPATTTSGSGGWRQLGWARLSNLTAPGSRRPETEAFNQLYRKALGRHKAGRLHQGQPRWGTMGIGLLAALKRKPSWTDQKKVMQSDESPHPRTPTPSTGPLLHSRSPRPHPTSTKPANSILRGSCVHIHIQLHSRVLAFPFPAGFPASE